MDSVSPVPPGHTVRAPRQDDAATVFGVFAAYNTSVVGFADCTLDDVLDNFAEPGFDLATDAWLAHDDDGNASGYGCVFPMPGASERHIELAASDPALARWLRDQTMARSREIAAAAGDAEVTTDIAVYRSDDSMRAVVAEAGFEPGTTFHRMRIDHHGEVPPPVLPEGVTLRSAAADPAIRPVAHAVVQAAFAGQFGFSPQTYDEWVAAREARTTFEWSNITVLELDGVPVAMREVSSQFEEDEDCGYVAYLAVLDEARGRGFAALLLRGSFADDAAAGRTGTILHVDTNNPTPALGLYTSVGMQAVLVIDVWRVILST